MGLLFKIIKKSLFPLPLEPIDISFHSEPFIISMSVNPTEKVKNRTNEMVT